MDEFKPYYEYKPGEGFSYNRKQFRVELDSGTCSGCGFGKQPNECRNLLFVCRAETRMNKNNVVAKPVNN